MAIEIWTAADLNSVRNDLAGEYIQMADIDLAGVEFEPIGNMDAPFTGIYDGGNYTVTNLYINLPTNMLVGLFGIIYNSTIKNITVMGDITGHTHVGGITGVVSIGNVINCHFIGNVTMISESVGGIVGYAANANIVNCSSSGNIVGSGGGIASVVSNSQVTNCFSTMTIDGPGSGGLILLLKDNSQVTNCYAAGLVTGDPIIIGEDTIYPGGLIGRSINSTIVNSYYDLVVSACIDNNLGIPKTTAELMQQTTFVNWDFTNVWGIDEGESYPYFISAVNPPAIYNTRLAQFLWDSKNQRVIKIGGV